MKNIVLILLISLYLISCGGQDKPQQSHDMHKQDMTGMECHDDGIFIHITESYNEPHRVLMPMKMANMMAKNKPVLVYLDIKAVELLVKGAKDLNYADFDSFQSLLKGLIEKNVGVYACPTCLKIAGFRPEDLMDGVQVAQKERFFDFTKGRIITLDY